MKIRGFMHLYIGKEAVAVGIIDALKPEDALLPDENMRKMLDIDSFDFLNLFIGLNEEPGVEISEPDYGQLNTLTNIALPSLTSFSRLSNMSLCH